MHYFLFFRHAESTSFGLELTGADIGASLDGPRPKKILEQLEARKITMQTSTRDSLIVQLTLLNMKRGGDVPHLRMVEFLKAVKPEEEDRDIDIFVSTCFFKV